MEKPDNQQKINDLNKPVSQPEPKKQPENKKNGNGGVFSRDGIPSVAAQKKSNGVQKGAAILIFGGGIFLMMLFGWAALVRSDKTDATDKANVAKKQAATAPDFKKPPEPAAPPEALPPLGASVASAPPTVPVIIEQPQPQPVTTVAPPVQEPVMVTAPPAPEPQPVMTAAPVEIEEAPPTPEEIRMRSPLMIGSKIGSGSQALSSSHSGGEWNGDLSEGTPNASNGGNGGQGGTGSGGNGQTALSSNFNATATPAHSARKLGNRNMLLSKGTIITCNMATRLETQIAGQTACVIPNNIYSDNGNVLLLERGSVVEGEYQRVAEMGKSRIFVLWTRVRTPNGVTVNLDSAASDQLGGAGMNGYVNNHWFKRFGNALMFSLIQDGIATGFQRLEKSKTAETVVYENSEEATDELVKEIIKSTSNIPPTIYKNQGDKVGIYISRDLDFGTVYKLRPLY